MNYVSMVYGIVSAAVIALWAMKPVFKLTGSDEVFVLVAIWFALMAILFKD